ncbi:hypothetical protein [uncultured Deinococcus sp.]|uniref:hypothetical protein n=1 Tax=uncultured Deinococcus sp. TaxID=158789 RepID=UPI0025EF330A|nr:hypothetical protein [uncultured Deinococcus sp.]
MTIRFLAALTACVIATTGVSITSVQQTHFNQVLSQMGATVVTCPTVVTNVDVCATYTGSPDLAMKSWDLYANWTSKVSTTAEHSAPWKQGGTSNDIYSAAFRLNDGSIYAVSLGLINGKTNILIATSSTQASAPAPTSSGIAGSPSSLVNDQAAPTRVGSLRLAVGGLATYGLTGTVKEFIQRKVKVDASGKETPNGTNKVTFLPNGSVASYILTDVSGKVTASSINTYVDGRIIERKYLNNNITVNMKYDYDATGNLISRTEYDSNGTKTLVTRYESKPNGYISSEYGASGDATRRTFVVQDAAGNELDEETLDKSVVGSRTITTFENGVKTRQVITIGTSLKLEFMYENGRVKSAATTAMGSLASMANKLNSSNVYRYEQPDGKGNFLKVIKGSEKISFGEKAFIPEDIEYNDIQYY